MQIFVHASAILGENVSLGKNCKIWNSAHLRNDVEIGDNVIVGAGAYIGIGVRVGRDSKIQSNALIYEPANIGNGVFIGPGVILTNDHNPRAITPSGKQKSQIDWMPVGVTIEMGASIGPGAICVAPVRIGFWSMVAAGSVVTRDVSDFALVAGVPAKQIGWVGKSGFRLIETRDGFECPSTGEKYVIENDQLRESEVL